MADTDKPVPPKTLPVFLPPSHPFARLSVDEFEDLFGVHAYQVVQRPIPKVTTDGS